MREPPDHNLLSECVASDAILLVLPSDQLGEIVHERARPELFEAERLTVMQKRFLRITDSVRSTNGLPVVQFPSAKTSSRISLAKAKFAGATSRVMS